MRMRPTGSAAVVLATLTLAVTTASPRPAQAFFFLPMFQNQPVTDSRQGRTPTDNRWRDNTTTVRPVKPSASTRSRDDDSKSSSSSAGKGAKSSTKSEANSGQTSRSRSVKQEPPASKSSGRASTTAHRTSPSGSNSSSASTPAQPASPSGSSASASVQEASPAGAGSTIGDVYDEKLGEVFKARIDELLKQSSK